MSYQLPDDITPLVERITSVGSRVTCDPAPTDTDADYLVLLHPVNARLFNERMACGGYDAGGSRVEHNLQELTEGEEGFVSFTAGEVNLIVTSNVAFYDKFLAATAVAKHLNVMVKADRIHLFQAVLYGYATGDLLQPLQQAEQGDAQDALDELEGEA